MDVIHDLEDNSHYRTVGDVKFVTYENHDLSRIMWLFANTFSVFGLKVSVRPESRRYVVDDLYRRKEILRMNGQLPDGPCGHGPGCSIQ
jgi:hypothetical protein